MLKSFAMLKSFIFAQILFVTFISKCFSEYEHDCPAEKKYDWTYNSLYANGPESWGEKFPNCNGRRQSPVNINRDVLKKDRSLQPLQLTNYDMPIQRALIRNDGHTVIVYPKDGVERTFMVNEEAYSLTQFHFHWGVDTKGGSEHTVNWKQYSYELQLVHENVDGKLAVIGVFYKEKFWWNTGATPIINSLKNVSYKGDEVEITSSIDLVKLFDTRCSFYRYTGSLTTPPCTQGVIWSICREESYFGFKQGNGFRELFSITRYEDGDEIKCKLSDNTRRTQPLNGRTIYSSL